MRLPLPRGAKLTSGGEIIQRLRRAASDGDLGSDEQSWSMLAGYQPKLLLARFGDQWNSPGAARNSTHILKPRLSARPDGLAREHYGHALAAKLGLANYRTELVGNGARQYLVIERYDRAVHGETVALIHQEDSAQAAPRQQRNSRGTSTACKRVRRSASDRPDNDGIVVPDPKGKQ